MNILYIGPYRHDQIISISSKDIIASVSKIDSANLTIRPVYLNNSISSIDDALLELENKSLLSEYDIVIEHAPIKLLTGKNDTFSSNTKFVAIPIMEPIINKKDYAKCLMGFDLVLTDNTVLAEILKSSYGLANKTELFSYCNNYTTEELIDLGIHNSDLKFYFIGSFTKNSSTIELILQSFYIAFHAATNISLVMVLTDKISNDIRKQVDDMILATKKKLNITESCRREKIIIKNPSIKELVSIHNTCDILISLYDYEGESSINKHIAMSNKNRIIDESKVKFFYDITGLKNEIYYFGELRAVTNNLELSTAMLESAKNNQTDYQSNNTIDKILCQ